MGIRETLRNQIRSRRLTVGAGFVLIQDGHVPPGSQKFCVEENVGAIPIALDQDERTIVWIQTPPVQEVATIQKSGAASVIALVPCELAECTPQVLSAGNPTLFIALKDKCAVDRAVLDGSKWEAVKGQYRLDPMCVFVFAPTPEGAYSRMFAPDFGVPEDPATGSSTGPLAYYMMRHGMALGNAGSRFISEQGTHMGRRSLLYVRVHGERGQDGIDVGGFVTPVIDGEIHL